MDAEDGAINVMDNMDSEWAENGNLFSAKILSRAFPRNLMTRVPSPEALKISN